MLPNALYRHSSSSPSSSSSSAAAQGLADRAAAALRAIVDCDADGVDLDSCVAELQGLKRVIAAQDDLRLQLLSANARMARFRDTRAAKLAQVAALRQQATAKLDAVSDQREDLSRQLLLVRQRLQQLHPDSDDESDSEDHDGSHPMMFKSPPRTLRYAASTNSDSWDLSSPLPLKSSNSLPYTSYLKTASWDDSLDDDDDDDDDNARVAQPRQPNCNVTGLNQHKSQ